MSGEMMQFPETIEEFLDNYCFTDKDKVYTNGSELIQRFRIEQALEHYFPIEELHECNSFKINVKAMQDVCNTVEVLIRNDYTCIVKPVHKKFPCENNIDYFEISFTKVSLR